MYETVTYLGEFASELSIEAIRYLVNLVDILNEEEFAAAAMALFAANGTE